MVLFTELNTVTYRNTAFSVVSGDLLTRFCCLNKFSATLQRSFRMPCYPVDWEDTKRKVIEALPWPGNVHAVLKNIAR